MEVKRKTSLIMVLMLLSMIIPTYSFANHHGLLIDGNPSGGFVEIYAGKNLIPVAYVARAANANIMWNSAERKTTIMYEGDEIALTIGQMNAMVNGMSVALDHSPVILNGRTMVSEMFIKDIMGFEITMEGMSLNVLIPKALPDIVDTAVGAGSFNTLAAALEAADLIGALKGEGPFTVFAPTDEAFAKLPEGTLEELLKPENKDMLVDILTYHVVAGQVTSADVANLTSATMLNGDSISINVQNGAVMVNDANVIAVDIMASNGVIHVIDTVILPPN